MKVEVPRGIEVLVKKAAVDPDFKAELTERRSCAADLIGLKLSGAEAAMLDGVPVTQLEGIIGNTTVSPKLRPAFTGRAAAVMLAALGVSAVAGIADTDHKTITGIAPDYPDEPDSYNVDEQSADQSESASKEPGLTRGISPDRPPEKGE